MDNNLPDWYSFGWGCIFDPAGRQKANEPFRSNMAATWAAPGVNFGRAHLAPISAQFGSNMVQLCPQLGPFKMGHMVSPIGNRQDACFHWYFHPP